MRMGPFSDPVVIDLLNRFFVPVQLSTDRYLKDQATPAEERMLLRDIWKDATQKELPHGTVHVYLVLPDGTVHDAMHVRDAAQTDRLLKFLRRSLGQLKTAGGKKLVEEPIARRIPRANAADSLIVHIAAEYTDQPGTVGEDWVILEKNEWQCFVPAAETREGWNIDEHVARKLLLNLYPFSQDWDVSHNEFSKCELQAQVISRDEEETLVSVRGRLQMSHNRYTNQKPELVDAEIVGTIAIKQNELPTFKLTTGQATYGGRPFDGLISNARLQPVEDRK